MERIKRQCYQRKKHYYKAQDADLVPLIEKLIEQRPSYGYRRITILLNALLKEEGKAKVNHKRVYRIMSQNNLLLPIHGKKPLRQHDGKVITLKRNTRWCTDAFAIQCANGDRVHVAFVLDSCDREVISYVASTIGIDSEAVQSMMLDAVEKRFGRTKVPAQIQWLSDNGPCYTATATVKLARELGFEVCTTPTYSPQSNGAAESLVKTIKRDYVCFGNLSCATMVMDQLNTWFEDYNENAPHKGLSMRSPRQFIRENLKAG